MFFSVVAVLVWRLPQFPLSSTTWVHIPLIRISIIYVFSHDKGNAKRLAYINPTFSVPELCFIEPILFSLSLPPSICSNSSISLPTYLPIFQSLAHTHLQSRVRSRANTEKVCLSPHLFFAQGKKLYKFILAMSLRGIKVEQLKPTFPKICFCQDISA